ncbi:enoyl-CoA hydratase-related protein [Haliea sp. E1-2-M8]|uniref:enoyl-CoA hydratase-related protein n=1 Tax=Haliea sp. E1-2-M8 TaxID=3064706 RepID=UPI00271724F9|nr:enoyl-CoA hydratase-related protein [Haliea sp. E1-2-M8]MDO8864006.1 enoyl-CoA hydratase-related protein [Haliea sp. E1-2-M8]
MTAQDYSDILYEIHDSAAIITLNRPKRLNAITALMGKELRHALARAENDKQVVGIVITGAGDAFCAGVDMADLHQAGQSGWPEKRLGDTEESSERLKAEPGRLELPEGFHKGTYSYFATINKPVIGAINGAVAGAGLALALFCDIRFFAESGYVSSSFSRRGLIAELGISWVLPKLVGTDWALDILWSSRKVFGKEAKEIGLGTRVYKDDELIPNSLAYISDIAENCSPASIAGIKGQVYRDLFRPPTEAFKEANKLMKESIAGPDFKEGVQSFLDRRKPNFARLGKN